MTAKKSKTFAKIEKLISELHPEAIPNERKIVLQTLIDFIQLKTANKQEIRLNFICTHNSRRSHLSQIWAQTIAYYFDIKNVFCYCGGTEATALFPIVAKTLQNSGFQIKTISDGENPIYAIKYAKNEHPIIGFSKKFDDDFNPKSEFAAIMTCDSANEACPIIFGAEIRIPFTFEDPKIYDHSPQQSEKYVERSLQIATELFYIFSKIKN
ncbi:arsenate reductase [Halpernia humi]|uniref:Arsenate reductase n=1 Tax=Halpernia humi TaxID=493375 RepID=A0A1H5XRW5_9FLAO|nr:protein-tyrosine-phosphatase [Halpernia humi]SEG14255.1 arsenate reductase [Halpernia humi]